MQDVSHSLAARGVILQPRILLAKPLAEIRISRVERLNLWGVGNKVGEERGAVRDLREGQTRDLHRQISRQLRVLERMRDGKTHILQGRQFHEMLDEAKGCKVSRR